MRQLFTALIITTFGFTQATAQLINGVIEGTTATLARITDTKCDSWGNRISVGYVKGTAQEQVDFDPDPDKEAYVQANSQFLAKYSPEGELIFVKEFVQIGVNTSYPELEILNDGAIVISGNAALTDFDAGPSSQYHPEINGPSAFIAKYDHAGRLLFLRSFLPEAGNVDSKVEQQALRIGQNSEIIIAGTFLGTIDFNPLAGQDAYSGPGLFISTFNSDGSYQRTDVLEITPNEAGYISELLITENGSVIVFGVYGGTIDLDPSAGEFLLGSPNCGGGKATFGCKLSQSGQFLDGFVFEETSGQCGASNWFKSEIRNGKIISYLHHGSSVSGMDLDPGPGNAVVSFGQSILELDTSFNYISHHLVASNLGPYESDFCLTSNGFAITAISAQTSAIDYTIGGNVDNLPTGTGFMLQYDSSYNFISGLVGEGVYNHSQGVAYNKHFDRVEVNWPFDSNLLLKDELGNEIESFSSSTKNQALISFSASYNLLSGTVFVDSDHSGDVSSSDVKLPNVLVGSLGNTGYTRYSVTNSVGGYFNYLDTGSFVTTASVPFQSSYWNMQPQSISQAFSDYSNYDTLNQFLMTYDVAVTDLTVTAFNTRAVRINTNVGHKVVCSNIGTQTETLSVEWTADPNYTLVSSNFSYSVNGSTITWGQIELEAFETAEIVAVFHNTAATGTTVTNTIVAIPSGTDVDNSNNTTTLVNTVIGSFDPNDKQVFPKEALTLQEATDGRFLDYLVRFQNTGNDTAFNVYILDTISDWLDIGSFQVLAASDDYQVTFLDSNVIEFRFTNILLPDSTIDEPNSHGHIAYRIKSNGGLSYADTIYNGASIFFDYNEPVLTNYTRNYIELITGVSIVEKNLTSVYPNPNSGSFTVSIGEEVLNIKAMDLKGRVVPINWRQNGAKLECQLTAVPGGIYLIECETLSGVYHAKVVVQ